MRAKRVAARAVAVALPVALAACSSSMPEPPTQMVTGGAIACPLPEPSALPPADAGAGVREVMGSPPVSPPDAK